MKPTKEHTAEIEDLLSSLAFSAGVEPLKIDFDRGVWILLVNEIDHHQLEAFSLSLANYDLKHVAVEFVK